MNYPTLCESCVRCKLVTSGTGSRFFLCLLSQTDRRFAKYPPQPVVRCSGYQDEPTDDAIAGAAPPSDGN